LKTPSVTVVPAMASPTARLELLGLTAQSGNLLAENLNGLLQLGEFVSHLLSERVLVIVSPEGGVLLQMPSPAANVRI
jgi:hypothetical protein